MPQEVIIRGSTYSTYDTNARGPVAMPYEYRNNVKRFNEAKKDVYGGANLIGDNPLFNWGFRQPYVWTSLNDSETKKYIKRYDSYEFPIGSTIHDGIRIGKMLASGQGILFLGRQFLLQSQAPFNETSLYNPLSIPQAILRPASLGLLDRPTRHVQLRGSILNTLLTTLGFGGGGIKPAPSGTTAAKDNNRFDSTGRLMTPSMPGKNKNPTVLPHENLSEGAGLVRARTANKGMLEFDKKWDTSNGTKPGFLTQLISHFAPGLTPLPAQKGFYRSDEESADVMLSDIKKQYQVSRLNMGYSSDTKIVNDGRFYFDTTGKMTQSIFQQYFSYKFKYSDYLTDGASEKETLLTDEKGGWKKSLSDLQGKGSVNNLKNHSDRGIAGYDADISTNFKSSFGEDRRESFREYNDIPSRKYDKGEPYGDNINIAYNGDDDTSRLRKITEDTIYASGNGSGRISATEQRKKDGFLTDDFAVGKINDQLNNILNEASDDGSKMFKFKTYKSIPTKSNRTDQSPSGEYNEQGYLKNFTSKIPGAKTPTKTIDDLGLSAPGGNYSDRQSNDEINSKGVSLSAPTLKNDLIMFMFKDLVNKKFIQFRATLSGISLSNNAEWENIRYLGRSDQIYIYKGFTQQLNFNFKVYPNNKTELINLWNKVDYMVGICQPSKYINDYITPPFMSLTIGKMYSDQPVIITSVGVNISDDTVWDIDEELPQFIEVSMNADILQTKVPNISNGHFGYSDSESNVNRLEPVSTVSNESITV